MGKILPYLGRYWAKCKKPLDSFFPNKKGLIRPNKPSQVIVPLIRGDAPSLLVRKGRCSFSSDS
jgi:hypothetical protein